MYTFMLLMLFLVIGFFLGFFVATSQTSYQPKSPPKVATKSYERKAQEMYLEQTEDEIWQGARRDSNE